MFKRIGYYLRLLGGHSVYLFDDITIWYRMVFEGVQFRGTHKVLGKQVTNCIVSGSLGVFAIEMQIPVCKHAEPVNRDRHTCARLRITRLVTSPYGVLFLTSLSPCIALYTQLLLADYIVPRFLIYPHSSWLRALFKEKIVGSRFLSFDRIIFIPWSKFNILIIGECR